MHLRPGDRLAAPSSGGGAGTAADEVALVAAAPHSPRSPAAQAAMADSTKARNSDTSNSGSWYSIFRRPTKAADSKTKTKHGSSDIDRAERASESLISNNLSRHGYGFSVP